MTDRPTPDTPGTVTWSQPGKESVTYRYNDRSMLSCDDMNFADWPVMHHPEPIDVQQQLRALNQSIARLESVLRADVGRLSNAVRELGTEVADLSWYVKREGDSES